MSNSRPKVIYTGINQPPSTPVTTTNVVSSSSHVGLSLFMSSKGTENLLTLNADQVTNEYGDDLFTAGALHNTHQTKYLGRMISRGGKVVTKRITLPGATVATMCLAAEVVVRDNPNYLRNSDGTYQYDTSGKPITDQETPTKPGVFIAWRVIPYSGFGMAATSTGRPGNTVGSDGTHLGKLTINGTPSYTPTTILPIMDVEMGWKGDRGNDFALALSAKDVESNATNTTFRPAFLSLKENSRTLPTPAGDLNALFSFDLNHMDLNGAAVDIASVIAKQFSDLGRVHVYTASLSMIRSVVLNGENGLFGGELTHPNSDLIYPVGDLRNSAMVDILTGTTLDGIPYYTLSVDRGNFGGLVMDGSASLPFSTGTSAYPLNADGSLDKLTTLKLYDLAVRAEFATMQLAVNAYTNTARYPFRAWWDSGYSMKTKLAAMGIKTTRPEVNVILSPYSVVDVVQIIPDPVIPPDGCTPDNLTLLNLPGFNSTPPSNPIPGGIRYQVNGGPILQTWHGNPGNDALTSFLIAMAGVYQGSPTSSPVAFSPPTDVLISQVNAPNAYDFILDYTVNPSNGTLVGAAMRGNNATTPATAATTMTFLPSPNAVVGADYGFGLDLYPFVFGSAASVTVHSCGRIGTPVLQISCVGAINELVFNILHAGGTYDFIVNGTAMYTGMSLSQLVANLQMNNSALFDVVPYYFNQPGMGANPSPIISQYVDQLYIEGFAPAQSVQNGQLYALYIRNKNASSQRIRLVNHIASGVDPTTVLAANSYPASPAPTLGNVTVAFEDADPTAPSVYGCLSGTPNISCVGAAISSGSFTLDGIYDIYLQGIRIASHIHDSDIPLTLSNTSEFSVTVPAAPNQDTVTVGQDYDYYHDPQYPLLQYVPNTSDTDDVNRVWWKLYVDDVLIGIAVGGNVTTADAVVDQVATFGAPLSDFVDNIPTDRALATLSGGFNSQGSFLQNRDSIPHQLRLVPMYNTPEAPMSNAGGNSTYAQDPTTKVITVTLAPYSGTPHV